MIAYLKGKILEKTLTYVVVENGGVGYKVFATPEVLEKSIFSEVALWTYHKVAQEITVIVSGRVEMCNRIFSRGDIILLSPGEGTSFQALTDTVTVAVKTPSIPHDKFTQR